MYTLSLSCMFDDVMLDCGTRFVNTRAPDLLLDGTVYTKIGVARSWQESLLECQAGGATLLSLGKPGVEQSVSQAIDVSDFWTGN